MKILIAPDSFKGSIEAHRICDIGEQAAKKLKPDIEVIILPMADGGEDTVSAVLASLSGERVTVGVQSPDFREIDAAYGMWDNTNAIMEMAEASGITKVEKRDIWQMNTFGTGQMVLDAVSRGAKTIYMGIGGSATNDCGIGFAAALGVKFLNANGTEVSPIPKNFMQIAKIDDSGISQKIRDIKFIVMCDVSNPLLGESGATHVFGKQKGVKDEDRDRLETGMAHVAKMIEAKYGKHIINAPGAGAAGGLGASLLAFMNATMRSGVEVVLDILNFDEALYGVDLVITGEGRMDYQSAFGKVCYGVGQRCKQKNIPCIAVVGSLGERYEEMYDHGITSIMTTVDGIMSLDYAIENAEDLCEKAMNRALRFALIGKNM